ncbi:MULTISPECIES: biotin/lipoyl-binding protein [Bradyrhizobium]|uniref:biotin/lipoyl-binding protein n=1 Tax=Bradyrhizobium TaxID=374 RepID=UPI000231D56F|nr:HlyD family secretion protein [Bradyrhizobium japonicum]AJA64143.1 multidrug transporter [Bradyrhizobium japonicum]KMJ98206.1 multidrug transporter [Bradyrhizobium japonicum]MBR0760856.1 HlyD family secretion protein [Bradyrhizobium japonicum]MCS3539020.1 RND family efflux transporter MFP subunit [Bradyrhizobium japonicum]MCS3984893.1 RND family efflux transporter MFP subunit [Bradyrhizobium japonicum]
MDAALPRDAAFPPHPESSAEARTDAADAVACSSPTEAAARATSNRAANDGKAPRQATPLMRSLRKATGRFMAGVGKHFATLAIALVAILISVATWQHYVTAPWTRNGSVRVQVANVAPQIAGKIVELRVADNQFVHKGDVLYVIDPFDFDVAVRIGKALVDQRAADLEVKQAEFDRRRRLSDLATTPEEQQIFAGNASQAKAAYAAAAHQLAQAELNLKRTNVLSPVDGYVTNLLLRVGDYALTGVTNVSIIDSSSFWIDGYFEETKMAHVCVGDRVEAQLVGYSKPILGHVKTVTRGISASNAAAGTQGLPSVDPIYTWVRLAQRIPVRVAIDTVPPGVPLVSGMTATVTIRQPNAVDRQTWSHRLRTTFVDPIFDVFGAGDPPRPNCLQSPSQQPPEVSTLPYARVPAIPSAEKIAPGLTPGIDASPRLP